MKNLKTLPGIVITISILAGLLYLAMYFSTNSSKVEELTMSGSPTPSAIEGLNDGSVKADEVDDQDPKTIEVTDVSVKNIAFFIDKNFNGIKDDGEMNCPYCKNVEVIIALENSVANPTTVKTDSNGKLVEDNVAGNNLLWGVIKDKNAYIGQTRLAFGDGASDIQVPIWEYSGVVAGVNANIENTTLIGNEVQYEISKLVPIMKTAYDSQKPITIKMTPNIENPNIYYTFNGTIKTSAEGTYYVVEVTDKRAFNAIYLKSNFEFLVY